MLHRSSILGLHRERTNAAAEADVVEDSTNSIQGIQLDELRAAVDELNHWCAALPECDGVAKLRGRLGRLEGSLNEFQTNCWDVTAFKDDLRSADEWVRRLHAVDPPKLLQRLSRLKEHVAGA
jgi:hypothetical protein